MTLGKRIQATCGLILLVAMLVLTQLVLTQLALAQSAVPASSAGSLFVPTGRLVDVARDFRASQVDDLITIVVTENASAVASGVTNTSRKSTATNGITALAGALSKSSVLANLANLSNSQQIQGTGQTSRTVTLATTVSARVTGVGPNGVLTIEGTKEMSVNSERQSITVRGLVRPVDLTAGNTVFSTQVANLVVQVNGHGVVGDAIKRPNILYRILLGILPF